MSLPGFRTKSIVVSSTFLDPAEMTKEELAFLLSRSLEQRTRSRIDQGHLANGPTTLQDTRAGTQGNLDAYLCLQPDPHHYHTSRSQARPRAANDQLQGGTVNLGSLSANDRNERQRIAQASLSHNPGCHCDPSCWRSTRSLRTTLDETTTHKRRCVYLHKSRNKTKRDMFKRVKNI